MNSGDTLSFEGISASASERPYGDKKKGLQAQGQTICHDVVADGAVGPLSCAELHCEGCAYGIAHAIQREQQRQSFRHAHDGKRMGGELSKYPAKGAGRFIEGGVDHPDPQQLLLPPWVKMRAVRTYLVRN